MKRGVILWFSILAYISINAQPRSVVLQKNRLGHKKGDTIQVLGHFPPTENLPERYLTFHNGQWRRLNALVVKRVQGNDDFWENTWFYYRSGDYVLKGAKTGMRNQLNNDCSHFKVHAETENAIFIDDRLTDYLNSLVKEICPRPLHKDRDAILNIVVVKSDDPTAFSFDNGTIVISTELLMQLNNESELVEVLTREVANIVLDHHFLNLRQQVRARNGAAVFTALVAISATALAINNAVKEKEYFTMDDAATLTYATAAICDMELSNMSPEITWSQKEQSNKVAKMYLDSNKSNWSARTNDEYYQTIANVATFSSWQYFYKGEYKEALKIVNKMEDAHLASQEDFLLKAKLYKTLYITEEANYEALHYLQLAKGIGETVNIEIFKEEGLLYTQLKQPGKSRAAFEEYRNGLMKLGESVDRNKEELEWVERELINCKNSDPSSDL